MPNLSVCLHLPKRFGEHQDDAGCSCLSEITCIELVRYFWLGSNQKYFTSELTVELHFNLNMDVEVCKSGYFKWKIYDDGKDRLEQQCALPY